VLVEEMRQQVIDGNELIDSWIEAGAGDGPRRDTGVLRQAVQADPTRSTCGMTLNDDGTYYCCP
jgi:hypothetical protein